MAVATYVANVLAAQVGALRWLRLLSSFHYSSDGEPLRNGLQLGDSTVLVAVTVVLAAVSIWTFNRRDVGG